MSTQPATPKIEPNQEAYDFADQTPITLDDFCAALREASPQLCRALIRFMVDPRLHPYLFSRYRV